MRPCSVFFNLLGTRDFVNSEYIVVNETDILSDFMELMV